MPRLMSAVAETLSALPSGARRAGALMVRLRAQAVAVRGAPRAAQDVDATAQVRRTRLGALVEALEFRAPKMRLRRWETIDAGGCR